MSIDDRPRPIDMHGQSAIWQAELDLLEHLAQAIPDPDDLRAARGWLDLLANLTELHVASDVTATAARAVGMTENEFGDLFEAELARDVVESAGGDGGRVTEHVTPGRCHHTDAEVGQAVRIAQPAIDVSGTGVGLLSYAANQPARVQCGVWDWAAQQGWIIPTGAIDTSYDLVDGGTRAVVAVARLSAGMAKVTQPPA